MWECEVEGMVGPWNYAPLAEGETVFVIVPFDGWPFTADGCQTHVLKIWDKLWPSHSLQQITVLNRTIIVLLIKKHIGMFLPHLHASYVGPSHLVPFNIYGEIFQASCNFFKVVKTGHVHFIHMVGLAESWWPYCCCPLRGCINWNVSASIFNCSMHWVVFILGMTFLQIFMLNVF